MDREKGDSGVEEVETPVLVDLVFDPVHRCYYDPATSIYYEIQPRL